MARDDFFQPVKQALAFRAGHVCSMPECGQSTVGLSEETPQSYTILGVAAHITAAAPGAGARRYDPNLSPAQRSSIDNGIWLCCNCATMIDRDATTYTADILRDIKRRHEANRRFGPKGEAPGAVDDLFAIGPSIICSGELVGVGPGGHVLVIKHFLAGDAAMLFGFANSFDAVPAADRYVLVNELGEGFCLRGPPSLEKSGLGYRLTTPLAPRARRTSVHKSGALWHKTTQAIFSSRTGICR